MAVHTTKQEVFNIVWEEFVVKERQQAWDAEEGKCVYRGSNPDTEQREADSDKRCVVGVCIPDDMYNPDIDAYGGIIQVRRGMPDWYKSVFNGIDVDYLSNLQRAHDNSIAGEGFTESIKDRLREIADTHALTIPE